MAKPTAARNLGGRIAVRAVVERLKRSITYFEELQSRKTVDVARCDGALSALRAELAWARGVTARAGKKAGGLGRR